MQVVIIKQRIRWIVFVSGIFFTLISYANEDQRFRPFILASIEKTDFPLKVEATRDLLVNAGFELLGEYVPYNNNFVKNAHVLVITNEHLKRVAALSEYGGFSAPWRVAITESKEEVQVAYPNPQYIAHAYRLAEDLKDITAQLKEVLGDQGGFGSEKGLRSSQLISYQYAIGMEEFDKPYKLGKFDTHQEAINALEHNLKANVAGLSRVYRLDIDTESTVFGIAIHAESKDDTVIDDGFIMSVVDSEDLKGTAYLPYEILVQGKHVYALHMRFRIAVHFPDTSLTGDHSFFAIQSSPSAIEKAFSKLVVH